jgi:hypothetical protein
MPVTKITLSTAMRARDVSRPHEEHLAEAAAREDNAARPPAAPPARPAESPATVPKPGPVLPPPAPRRRRRRRS